MKYGKSTGDRSLNRLGDNSDWNDSDEEEYWFSEKNNGEDGDEMDYLTLVQVLYRRFFYSKNSASVFLEVV